MNALHALPAEPVDLLVIGSGAAGLSAAVTAAALGLRVAVVEKEAVIGGTSAWSGGWLWIPRNRLAVAAGIREDIDGPRSYLRHELGEAFDAARIEAFLRSGPRMVDFFTAHTALQFIDGNGVPDFHGHSPGAVTGGRSLCAAPFDGRALGEAGAHLRPPLDLISFWGMGIASGADVRHFLNAARSLPSLWHVVKRVTRHLRDLAVLGRGMQLVNGNALVARLMEVGARPRRDDQRERARGASAARRRTHQWRRDPRHRRPRAHAARHARRGAGLRRLSARQGPHRPAVCPRTHRRRPLLCRAGQQHPATDCAWATWWRAR